MRVTWIHPEDLVGHELRQADQDGRDPDAVARVRKRWYAAGGHDAPPLAGASPEPAAPEVRALAEDLLDELSALPSPLAGDEPTDLPDIIAACPEWPVGPVAAPGADLADRVLGAWTGRAAGCVLGKPVEKIPRAGIREIAETTGNWPVRGWFTAKGLPDDVAARWPWNRRSAPTSLAETLDGTPEDDDLNFPMLGLALLERFGPRFTSEDVAQMWLDELPPGRIFTAERVAVRNLLTGVVPPRTARVRNPFREWIGALIRADVFGWTNPGDPGTAAMMAHRDAVVSHTANGVYGAMFAAALAATAPVADSPAAALETALRVVPPRSRLAEAVRDAMVLAAGADDFEEVVDGLYAAHGHLHWVHAVNNAAVVAAALVHGGGDFADSITKAVSAGWDTDSVGATVGSAAGALRGASALPEYWTTPLRGRIASSLTGFDGITFAELAARTLALRTAPAA
ncbi:ADP-ribosylglycohydrolase family protein [Streptomonospora sp. S1-112]|uniref:ADP-ribosylglycohydrolase family protein n=1 Tax=Streptomonospora mangrovi TaxID=2883123 RepID=A0A9X3NLQ6_9ACTN|nr:ADP-ribosylglycohydrolase family protein [Streptomonospora mangrovi]MDA0564346.1 ADP-ribosylglycohydrolase family protein [Streptomonospora mangrovi]